MKEAYVSFEVAKLLKAKRFNERSFASYDSKGELQEGHGYWNKTPIWYAAPTHQMTLAWLREKHKLFILVGWLPIQEEYFTRIFNMTDLTPKRNVHEHTDYNEAVDEAIKYCLENLI